MNPEATPPVVPTAAAPARPAPKRRRWLLFGCGGLLLMLLLVVCSVAITIWWIQRPIKPVVLTPAEKAVVDDKVRQLDAAQIDAAQADRPPQTSIRAEAPRGHPNDPVYVPGGKVLRLTERELNGLLNANTDLGDTVRLELGRDAINAYLAVPIPEDFPIGGGRIFRARGRFRLAVVSGEPPYVILEDVTVFGLSLPKAWLGGLKGENLLANAVGGSDGSEVLRGVKSLRVVPGALVLEVAD